VIVEACVESQCIGQIDGIVAAIFHLMLGRSCGEADDAVAGRMDIAAKVLFSGAVEGCCLVEFSVAAARELTEAFLGPDGVWDDTMVEDAVGELCNMIAGGWKSKLGEQAAACQLSAPKVWRGVGLEELSGCGKARVARAYGFGGTVFRVELMIGR
jgi:chemotaxis protein CheX